GQKLKAEFNREPHVRGTVSMARAQSPDSGDSQFFICFDDARFLDGKYTVWGKVTYGMENIDKIKRGEPVSNPDKIVKAHMKDAACPGRFVVAGLDRANHRLTKLMHARASPRMAGCLFRADLMRTDLFDFDLPPERIALRPASPRDSAGLLVVRPGAKAETEGRVVGDLPDLLRAGDQLVVNDTKVIPAALHGRRIGRATEPTIEANLIKRLDGSRWQALVKPAKKLAVGDVIRFGEEGKVCFLGQ